MAHFRILGPIEAWNGERRLAVGGRRQLVLFAFFVLHANQAVPTDTLIDAVWGTAGSAADNRLQMAVARLRKALAPLGGTAEPLLRTVSRGYLLTVRPEQLDAAVFEHRVQDGLRAIESGEPARARDMLSEADDLWRGPAPLAEVGFEDFALAEIRRLEELRLFARATRIDADLQLGRHGRVIGEIEGLLAQHQTDERLAAQLMLALYRSSRQADALEVYQRTRTQLREQLGVEPGPALQSIQSEILQQAPSLVESGEWHQSAGPRTVSPATLAIPLPSRLRPYGPPVFVDRRSEREAVARALARAASFGRQAAFVTGEPGIGKTRLVSEIACQAHAGGTVVLAGRCDEGLGLPYQPFAEALEHLVEHAPAELLERHLDRYGDSLGRLVPGLVPRAPRGMPDTARASESERYVLFGAIEGMLAAAGAAGPLLLVLEDLHWADLPTLNLLRRLLGSPRRSSLVVLCTCRVNELGDDHPLRQLLADIHREPDVLRLELEGLTAGDVAELLQGLGDARFESASEELVGTLESSTNGNPFFITELVRNLLETDALTSEHGRWGIAADIDPAADLPVSITETLARRLGRMGEDVRACLRIAAVIGQEFDLELVSQLADGTSPASALDLARREGILVEIPGRSARFRFAHALMQRYLYTELGGARRAELHGRIASAIEARVEEGRASAAEVARHLLAAADADRAQVIRYAVIAGNEALSKLAPDDARRWYQIAFEILSALPDAQEAEACELLVRRGEAERQAGDPRFRETLLEAAAMARRIGHAELLVRAALANTRGMQSETGTVDEARIAALGAALRAVGQEDSPDRAALLAMQAAELMYSSERDRRVQLSNEALAIARRLRDLDSLSRVLNLRFVTLLAPETLAERRENASEAIAAAELLRDPLARFYAYHWRGYASVETGDIAEARAWVTREREIADRFHQPTALWLTRADEANLAIVAGELDVADRLCASALELGRSSEPDALACYTAQRTSIAFESGRLAELVPELERAVRANPGVPGFRATLALALTEDLRLEPARQLVEQASERGFRDLPHDVTWLAATCIYAIVSSRLEHDRSARALYSLLKPWDQQIAFPAFGVWGPVSLHLGTLAITIGDRVAAGRYLTMASDIAGRAGAPLWGARAAAELARLAAMGS